MIKNTDSAIKVTGIAAYVTNSAKRKYAWQIVNKEGHFYYDEGYFIMEADFFAKYPIELKAIGKGGLDGRTNWIN